jgi:hypothetical protein
LSEYHAVLGASDRVDGRPFADPEHTSADAAVMSLMLLRQREAAQEWDPATAGPATVRDREEGHKQWLAVPDAAALLRARDVTAVGFFGQARDSDHSVLFELEQDVVESFPEYASAGLLSYFDLELANGAYGFGNLILFATPDVPREWHTCRAHERAVAISPEHYHSVRLHKGTIPGPFLGSGDVTIERTKYFDFDSDPPWRGLRTFAG